MARLVVVAASEDAIATPGNRKPTYIVVSVTDANGAPVTGLGASNFKVRAKVVGPGGAAVKITRVSAGGGPPGFYCVDVVPVRQYTWKKGVYIFAVAVRKGTDRGQTLATTMMD